MDYRAAGVDIDAANRVVHRVRDLARQTFTPGVLSDIGSFGGLFQPEWDRHRQPVLVASADGVGTKLKVAFLAGRHDTVGVDLVNHCVNDVLVQGARPLFFLDYLATGRLAPDVSTAVVQGLARGCVENGCALLGGETAEMPGFYAEGEYDLAGFIVGIVDRGGLIDGSGIVPGDRLVGLPSAGLHTNGFSLARRIVFDTLGLQRGYRRSTSWEAGSATSCCAPTGRICGPSSRLLESTPGLVRGLAHITGGGLTGNLPRVLPPGTAARIVRDWQRAARLRFPAARGERARGRDVPDVQHGDRDGRGGGARVRGGGQGPAGRGRRAWRGADRHGRRGRPAGRLRVGVRAVERRGLLQGRLGAERADQATIGGLGVCAVERRRLLARVGWAATGAAGDDCRAGRVAGGAVRNRRIGVLISGRGSNLQAIIDSIADGRLDATIAVVISNRAGAAGLARAARAGIETLHIDHKGYGSREAFDRAVVAELRRRDVALVCLAGFMRLLSAEFVGAFPTAFSTSTRPCSRRSPGWTGRPRRGSTASRSAGRRCTSWTPELDAGPIVRQAVVPVDGADSAEALAARILVEEHRIYPEAIGIMLDGGWRIEGRRFIAGRGVDDA